jgi:outer membrane protein OmpA-like peptidoglycan-associated protein
MTRNGILFICILAVFSQASCARNGNVFVLLPGPDGKTGEIRVTSKGGTQILRQPKQTVVVQSAESAPSLPMSMNEEKIRENFGDALSALPAPPVHFTLYFNVDSAMLTGESQKSLQQVLTAVVSRKSTDVSVVGHTDRVGTREYNYRLGLGRARMIANILICKGIDRAFVSVSSHGEDDPLIKTGDGVPEPRNRRVEVIVR